MARVTRVACGGMGTCMLMLHHFIWCYQSITVFDGQRGFTGRARSDDRVWYTARQLFIM
jgi:hypothetical protein